MLPFRHRFALTALSLAGALACSRPQSATPQAEPTSAGQAAGASSKEASGIVAWWDEPYPETFDAASLPTRLSPVHVQGNHFEDEAGHTLVLRGVNISDPDKLEQTGQLKKELFSSIASWGAKLVRVPVHPTAWRRRGRAEYFELLDQIVRWANEESMYLIIDWHSIGNLQTEMYQHPMYDTTRSETLEFWRAVAFRYKGVSTVAFYELFNEPTRRRGTLGAISWEQWKAINEEIISVIYAHDEQVIPLVAGFNWAYDLRPVAEAPIDRKGVAYVSHPYPQKTNAPFEENWEEVWGFVAKKYPLVATEMGFMGPDDPGAHRPALNDGSYGPMITNYLQKKGASWTAWCFDPDWAPQLISDWNYTPTAAGKHFRKAMLEAKAPGHERD